MNKLRVLDLFSGIGGFSLGLERTGGFETVAFCEIEEFPRRVLAKHWPEVPCYHDVRELTADKLAADGISVDVICGGFPCQDISTAGPGGGLDGERSGLWFEYARIISEVRPKFVIVENTAALLVRGIGRVLGSLAAIRYDAEWHCIPASSIGAPHQRDRLWIVAYPKSIGHRSRGAIRDFCKENGGSRGTLLSKLTVSSWWEVEPPLDRVANGLPHRVDRIKGLGNAVVPQIPELIGHAILEVIARKAEGEAA